jgi:hypothetical protein
MRIEEFTMRVCIDFFREEIGFTGHIGGEQAQLNPD